MKQLKTYLQYFIVAAIGAYFLYFVFKGTNWNEMADKFARTNYYWIALGMAVAMFSHFIRGARAVMFYEALGYKVPLKNSVLAVLVGYMMNYIIPRGGEVSRCAALYKTDNLPVDKSLGTVVAERAFDLLILLVLLLIVFFLQFDMLSAFLSERFAPKEASTSGNSFITVKTVLLSAIALGCILFFALRKRLMQLGIVKKLMQVVKGFTEGLMSVKKVKRPVLFILQSFAIWVCYVLMMYFCLFAMEATAHINFIGCLTIFAIGTIGVVVPAPGAGAGTYHFAVMQSMLLFNVPEADGIAYATIVHGAQMILLLALGAVASVMVLLQHRKKSA